MLLFEALNKVVQLDWFWRVVEVLAITFASIGILTAMRQSRIALKKPTVAFFEGGLPVLQRGILRHLDRKHSNVDIYREKKWITEAEARAAERWLGNIKLAVSRNEDVDEILAMASVLPTSNNRDLHVLLEGLTGELEHYRSQRLSVESRKKAYEPKMLENIADIASPLFLIAGVLLALLKAIFQP